MRISYATSFPGTFAWFGGSLGKVGPIFMDIVISERIFQVKNEKKKKDGKQFSFELQKPPQVCASWKV